MNRIDVLQDQLTDSFDDTSNHLTNDLLIDDLIENDVILETLHDLRLDLSTVGTLLIVIGIDENVIVDPATLAIYLFLGELGSIDLDRVIGHDPVSGRFLPKGA